jgi:hypothetical protein
MLGVEMKNYLFSILLFISCCLAAQSKEKDRLNWGIFSGIDHHALGMETLGQMEPESPLAWSDGATTGLSGGLFLQKRLFPWLEFQPELGISLVNQTVQFHPDGSRRFRFYDLELPLHLRVVDAKKEQAPMRASILVGPRFSWNLAGNSKEFLTINQERIAIDLGLGVEIKLKHWRIQPAFIYSHGLNDLHFPSRGQYDDIVGRIVRDKLSLKILCWKAHK